MRTIRPGNWQYFAEGAANVLFQYSGSDPELKKRLLRLRKNCRGAPSTQQLYCFAEAHLEPFLGQYIVPVELVLISRDLLRALAHYGINADETHALLVDLVGSGPTHILKLANCAVQPCERSLVVEFKPKWLLQSPNAPGNAQRCRTCALRRKRGKPSGFCPLDLGSDDPSRVSKAVSALFEGYAPAAITAPRLIASVTQFILRSDLIKELKLMQSWDTKGILGYGVELPVDFLVAMTCRDCTVFLEIDLEDVDRYDDREDFMAIDLQDGGPMVYIRGRLIDLDFKSISHKRQYWTGIEQSLLDEGWYFDK
ncbi:hypothetical protein TRVA0_018S01486 [Trichomonascus vanleenenianus]|uniref:inositol-pentakisphosphate 2-kinase n=1 Tax=Trichomonascus vanleenenianus TaxID=2268995 RepID=UPI003ECAC41C